MNVVLTLVVVVCLDVSSQMSRYGSFYSFQSLNHKCSALGSKQQRRKGSRRSTTPASRPRFNFDPRLPDDYDLEREGGRNISDLLDTLLLGYDNHLRPGFGGKGWTCA